MEEKLNKNQGEVGGGFAEIPDEALLDASGGSTTPKPYPYGIFTSSPYWRCNSCGNIMKGNFDHALWSPGSCDRCGSKDIELFFPKDR